MAQYVDVGPHWRYQTMDEKGLPVAPLGKGMFGAVYLGFHKTTGVRVAIKISTNKDPHMNKHIDNELHIQPQLQHPHVVRCYYVENKYEHEYNRRFCMVLEYLPGGTLESYLHKRYPQGMPEPEARRMLCQIASAFQYLSQRGYSHRDLKPANILLTDWSKGAEPDIKVADFGFVRTSQAGMMESVVGSPLYMAPEVLSARPYSANIDVWSAGIIFLQLLTGKLPFPTAKVQADIVRMISEGVYLPTLINGLNISDSGKDMIRKMLTTSDKRLSWDAFMEQDYIRPSAPQDLAASVVQGTANWVLVVTSFESGLSVAVPVAASTPVETLRAQVARTFQAPPTTDSPQASANPSELMLLTPRNGAMFDGSQIGDYFKPPQSQPTQRHARMDNVIHACWKSTWEGNVPIWELPDNSLTLPTILFTGGRVPHAEASSRETEPISADAKLPLSQMTQSLAGNAKWHAILSDWRASVEDHLTHAADLVEFVRRLNVLCMQISNATGRKSSFLALNNYIRTWTSSLASRFEPIVRVIKEVSPTVTLIRDGIPAMFDEARAIPLAPLCTAFPMLTLDPNASLLQLLAESGMREDLDHCIHIHKQLLLGELSLGKSSDVESALAYNIPNAKYSGPSFTTGVAVLPQQQPGAAAPELIRAMVDINSTLSSMKFFLIEHIQKEAPECARLIHEAEDKYEQQVSPSGNAALQIISAALQKPASFELSSDSMCAVLTIVKKLADAHHELVQAATAASQRLDALSALRIKFDLSCAEVMHNVALLREPFTTFEAKFTTEWSPGQLDFIAAKSGSLARLVEFPQMFKDLLIEIERRRKWVNTMTSNVSETRAAYNKLVDNEVQMRQSWHAAHIHTLNRFRTIFPADYELLKPTVPGCMSVSIALNGVYSYPLIDSPFMPSPSSSNGSSTAGSNMQVPVPQNPTEEEIAKQSSLDLLTLALRQRREIDHLVRQRTAFFQTGVDAVAKQENVRLLGELDTEKLENLKLRTELNKALAELEKLKRK